MLNLISESKNEKSGIEVISKVPWGTHLCLFYENKDDLLDILIPYFKEGLENNEYCMWVTSEPLNNQEAVTAAMKAIPNFEKYTKKNQIEIIPHDLWYLKDNVFDFQRVLNDWIEKLDNALKNGFNGLRITGNNAWLEKKDWKKLTDYEEIISMAISNFKMKAICTYSLEKCGPYEILDVIHNHESALIRRDGNWINFKSMEQIKAEQKLKESEEHFRKMIEYSSDVISIMGLDGKILYQSPSCEKIFGYKPEVMIGTSAYDYIHPDDQSYVIKTLEEGLRNKLQLGNVECRFKHEDGSWVHVEAYGSNLFEYKGVQAIMINTRNITERKRAEQKLKESEEKYRLLVENAHAGIWAIDAEANTTYVNEKMAEILGYTPDEMLGNHLFSFMDEEGVKIAELNLERRKQGIKEQHDFEFIRKDGSRVYTSLETAPILDDKGDYIGAYASVADITERKKAEEKIEYLAKFPSENPNPVLRVKNGIISYSNKVGSNLFNISEGDYIPESLQDAVNEAFSINENQIIELELNGNIYSFVCTPVVGGDYVNIYGMEITDIKKAEMELINLNKLKSELLTRASHELKTPLISIKGYSDLLLELHKEKFDDMALSSIRQIKRGCDALEKTVNNILNTTYLDSGQVSLNLTVEDLSFLIAYCVNDLKSLVILRDHKISLKLHYELVTKFEKERIYEVLSNLIINAIKYTPVNGLIEIKSEIKEEFIIISIKDNGIGFTNEEKGQIFKQFGKIERYGQGWDVGIEGTGLGLYISKKIIELHGGKIWMESKGRNKGSTFYFSLPII